MKKVVISGAGGFIGSHLVDRFLREGWYVVGIDNFLTGNRKNIEHNLNNSNFELVTLDISVEQQIRIDAALIMHFASPASPIDYYKYPIKTLRVNSIGTLNLLENARAFHTKFLMASTSEVYGDPAVHPQVETYFGNVNPNGIRSVYDEGKRFSEAATMAYHREYDLDARIVRIFNTYGPRMKPDDGRIIPNFIMQAMEGKPITIYGNGKQTRSYCYVSDLVEGIYRMATLPDLSGKVVNLGNPEEYTVIETAEIIKGMLNSKSEFKFLDPMEDDPQKRNPDIKKAKKLLKWEPAVPFEQGIKKTIEYFRTIKNG